MKRKITLFFIAATTVIKMNSQVVLVENFDGINPPTSNGWVILNNSSPAGGAADWFQGNPNAFPSYNGTPSDYFAVNYQSVPTGAGDISTWLFTPTVVITNGAVFQFATRAAAISPIKADHLELRMSTGGGFTVPTGTASVGTFTNVLLNINPNLNTLNQSAVSNGSVNGFPQAWTVYNVTISGVTGTVVGMFAFRSAVPNGGSTGANSRYVGIDGVKYTLPCGPTVSSFTTCAGVSTTLTAIGGLASTTYSWSTGSNSISTVVSPSVTTVYTLSPSNGTVSCGVSQTATVTVGTALSMSISATSNSVCSGTSVTLTAIGSATNYLWNTGATSPVIVVNPGAPTTYTVGGLSGVCGGTSNIVINTLPTPTVNAVFSPTAICPSATFVATGTGASTYNWVLSSTSSVAGTTVSLIAPANPGSPQFTLVGTSAAGCIGSKVVVLTVNPIPVVTALTTKDVICVKDTVTWVADGATNYTWTPGGAGSTTNPRTYTAAANPSTYSVFVVGSALGCRSPLTFAFTMSVVACTPPNPVGVINYSADNAEVSAFPNPFTNTLKITGINSRVEIINAIGQVIYNEVIRDGESIDTGNFSKGVYVLKAYANDGELIKSIKVIKN